MDCRCPGSQTNRQCRGGIGLLFVFFIVGKNIVGKTKPNSSGEGTHGPVFSVFWRLCGGGVICLRRIGSFSPVPSCTCCGWQGRAGQGRTSSLDYPT